MSILNDSDINISLKSWSPVQVPTTLPLRRQVDCYDQHCVKFNDVGVFHSRAQLLYSAILEGMPSVSYYVPRPFSFNAGGRLYTPHFYVNDNNHKYVREVGSQRTGSAEWQSAMERYCTFNSHSFEFIPSEWIFERHQLAENWLSIVRILARNIDHYTESLEQKMLLHYLPSEGCTFGELIASTKADQKHFAELAVFRLLHRGTIKADLRYHPLSYELVVESCT
jgi:hypothetical protein